MRYAGCKLLRDGYQVGARVILFLVITSLPAHGQVTTQQIPLSPGWNAVFLEVTPEESSCAAVFAGLPVASVWRWMPKTSTVQFVEDPSSLAPEHPDWLVYFPASSDEHALSTLHVIHGGRPYLVRLRGALPATLSVKGQPAIQSLKWQADSFNFVGFSVSGSQGPTFQSFFGSSTAHAGQNMYRLNTQGRWEQITNPGTARLERSRAYWVYCQGHSAFQGPLHVLVDQGRVLDFSDVLVESSVHLKNESALSKNYTLTLGDSESPDSTVFPARAGAVALSYWKADYANDDVGWRDFDSPLVLNVGAGKTQQLRLAVRRTDLAPYMVKSAADDHSYQSLLWVEDGAGIRLVIPVSARGLQRAAEKASGTDLRAGLWAGSVTLDKVTEHVPLLASEGPQPTASEFQFKVLVHVDAQGLPRLLRQVTQLWRPGTYMPDPEDPELNIVDRPGEFVLFTDLEKIDEYINADKVQGAVLRDGTPVGRRLSTSIFGFDAPLALAGVFPRPENPASVVSGTVVLDYNDPLNPFMHRYHPDHNNLKPDYATMLDEGIESWTVIRHLTFEFTENDPEYPEGALAGWGDTQLGGIYTEVLEGLHRHNITVQGTFRLRRVSNVAQIDPDL